MAVTVSKEFRWEMGHRLPYHPLCRNVHGHSYRMLIEAEGEPGANGMVVDFADIVVAARPLIEKMDHAFMLDPSDSETREFLCGMGLKVLEVPFYSTAENIAVWAAGAVSAALFLTAEVENVRVHVFETATSCAETSVRRPG